VSLRTRTVSGPLHEPSAASSNMTGSGSNVTCGYAPRPCSGTGDERLVEVVGLDVERRVEVARRGCEERDVDAADHAEDVPRQPGELAK
jgi:hypothetical protein